MKSSDLFVVETGIKANGLGKFLTEHSSGRHLSTIDVNIRWHQKQLTPRSYAYVYADSGLHGCKRDISISISIRKWKRFLFLMLMLMLMSLLVNTAFAYTYVYAYAYAYVTV